MGMGFDGWGLMGVGLIGVEFDGGRSLMGWVVERGGRNK